MKMVEAYIRHEAFEPIRTELLELGLPLAVDQRGEGLGPAEGHHRALPRRGADELPAAEDQDRVRRRRRATCRRSSTRSSSTRAPAPSATARSSSCRSRRPTASAPASPARRSLQAHPDAAAANGLRGDRRCREAAGHDRDREPAACRRRRRRSSSGCAPSTWRWSTPSSAATASSGSRSWPPTRPARPVAIVIPRLGAAVVAPAGRGAGASAWRSCAATSATALRDRPVAGAAGGRRRGADRVRRRAGRRRPAAGRPTAGGDDGRRVPAPRPRSRR